MGALEGTLRASLHVHQGIDSEDGECFGSSDHASIWVPPRVQAHARGLLFQAYAVRTVLR